MKLFFVSQIAFGYAANPGPCHLRAADYENCQELCDTTSFCEAWSFHKPSGVCEMKERNGWAVEDDRGHFCLSEL